jgi:beta-galactosidase
MPLVTAKSPHSVSETIARAVSALQRRDVHVFARVDHGNGARAAGLELGDEELLIFGDPRVGTLLMQSDPRIGYELPLRLLAWDQAGQTMVAYRQPTDLVAEYAVADQAGVLERISGLLEQLLAESVAPS